MGTGTPAPIFLKRSIASNQTEQVGVTLLDGGGTPGMSGASIVAKHDDRWWLFGIYTGILFPDHMYGSNATKNDRFAALGMMAQLSIARAFMDVPGLFKKNPG